MRGKGRLVHGALETLTHTTQQVTTHSSEPHPQASGVVPSSHTMRWLLAVSCLSLSRAVPIPTSPITPAPETRAPPTVVPRAACEALLSPPLVATIKAPVEAQYVECWTFQCVGTVEVTFRNISTSRNGGRVSLQNSDGYVLTSLLDDRERYIATYPANGEMTVVFNDTWGRSNYRENKITFEWECNTGPAVVPAAGFDASTYLTLPPAGTYEWMFSELAISSWLIPCTGMLDIAASSSSKYSNVNFIFTNSNGTVLRTDWGSTTFNGSFSVAGNFNITLYSKYTWYSDGEFAFAWSCGGTRPDLPSHDLTSAPETLAPRTVVPRVACEALSSPPLVASIRAPVQAEYVECWTFQCVGTVEVTFRNISTSRNGGRVMLQNSDGYVLTSLVDNRERYIATYPANGEMTVVFNDTWGRSNYRENKITFEWVCHTGPAVVPAAGFDASTYLTLPPAGTYERMFSEPSIYSWLIPCTGMLDIAASSSSQYILSNVNFIFTNSNGTVLRTDWRSTTFNGSFSVAGNFNITLLNRYQDSDDSKFTFAWSCGGTRPDFPSHDLTPAPETRAPPTVVPRAACEALLSPPLVATIKAPVEAQYVECWTFQCVGTVEVTFRNISTSRNGGRVTLQNSDGYVLTSLVDDRERYIATYPANGEMTVVFNDTGGRSNYRENKITFEWVCHTGPAVVPAAGFDASTYLTLPPAGTYERMFSEQAISSWLIPCTGMLDIAASSSSTYSNVDFIFMNSNGTILRTDWRSTSFNGSFSVAGNFNITLLDPYQDSDDSDFVFTWSCGGAVAATYSPLTPLPTAAPMTPATAASTLVPSSAPMSPAPDTATPTNVPAGASYVPGTSAPDTALPTTTPTATPDTATPTSLPAGASHAPGTSAPDTALPTATPTDLPAGATFAPSAPAVKALCTADKDCRSGRLDPKATCNAGTCVCHTQGYVHPTGVPLCLLADDVTVPMAFAVEYYGVEAGSLWTTATTRESFEETMSEALGIVTDMRVVVSDGGVLVVGMVRASTAKLADALSGKVDLSAALSSDGVSVSHGVTCARTDASYTVQHNGVCDAVKCEGNTTLTLTDGTHTCEREAAPLQPEESGGSSNVVLYVGIGVGVLVVAVCVVAAFCCLQKKQRVKEFEDPLFEMSREDAELYPTVEEVQADPAEELSLL